MQTIININNTVKENKVWSSIEFSEKSKVREFDNIGKI